ncbi:MAG: winged helix-turn-helix domain-containing protein [Anaerolineae bacterium]|nr:winged helix-turn-helix domain-containing protein [Anaerolineae bacterium]
MSEIKRPLRILEALERNPETTQANLAAQLGVAVDSVNGYIKRLIRKGYVKWPDGGAKNESRVLER